MSFNSPNLSVLAYANNFTLWHYRVEGNDGRAPADNVISPGYFNNAVDMLRVNDRILIDASEGTFDLNVTGNDDTIVIVQWAAHREPQQERAAA